MAEIINVLIAFDTETIIKTYTNPSQDPNKPTQVTTSLIYMIVRQGNAISGQAGGNLNIKAQVGDIVRWRETSLSLSAESNALLYAYIRGSGEGRISNATAHIVEPDVPLPNPDDPLHPKIQNVKIHNWTSEVERQGTVGYTFRFMILDRDEGLIGYYYWDPSVTIRP